MKASSMTRLGSTALRRGARIVDASSASSFKAPFIPLTAEGGFVDAVGNTPLVRLNKLSEQYNANIYGKAEFMNPGGSVKDRAALFLIKDAEAKGQLGPGGTVVEGTAGNTGIGLAHVCRARGYKCVIYMPNTQSQGKIDMLRLLGAEVHPVPVVPLSDPMNFNNQAQRHAESTPNAVWTNQFDNLANREAHVQTTGPEIWAQTNGEIDAFTCSTGTGGSFAGVTQYLKDISNNRVQCVIADPPGSILYSFWESKGEKMDRDGSSITEGIGQGRVTDNMKSIFENEQVDWAVQIPDAETILMIYRLLDEEGIFLGASSALNVVAAAKVAEKLGPNSTVVTLMCDSAERYAPRLFSRKWLESKDLLKAIPAHLEKYIVLE